METLADPFIVRALFGLAIAVSIELSRRTNADIRELRASFTAYLAKRAEKADDRGAGK